MKGEKSIEYISPVCPVIEIEGLSVFYFKSQMAINLSSDTDPKTSGLNKCQDTSSTYLVW